jgi:membrane protein YdbS with pleckstrin-like domain
VEEKDIVDINIVSAVLFLVLASVFLILLYYFMSNWFLILLVVLFCIGGFEVLCHPSFQFLSYRIELELEIVLCRSCVSYSDSTSE